MPPSLECPSGPAQRLRPLLAQARCFRSAKVAEFARGAIGAPAPVQIVTRLAQARPVVDRTHRRAIRCAADRRCCADLHGALQPQRHHGLPVACDLTLEDLARHVRRTQRLLAGMLGRGGRRRPRRPRARAALGRRRVIRHAAAPPSRAKVEFQAGGAGWRPRCADRGALGRKAQ
eukprot:CAMPEP_0198528832 /NCGR_PEP_ID=MMETSP1462-20131121/25392_1 /TAXON_ID=1333877 /ORGANISM="Brandtodinium nutriculum, Strain RCC3387" /LENGTH=174 /DNA_ID=CAMNT_0044258661 /DNA_START=110 /DNA_END=631 /DNA_ORIENTATION=-